VLGGYRFSSLAVGWGHTCALAPDGRAYCWGRNASGELGDGSGVSGSVPTEVAAGARRFVALTAGSAHTCGLTTQGQVFCWGQNTFGQLGDGGTDNALGPVAVDSDVSFDQVVAGATHTCARATDRTAYCWGRNPYGQVGDGTNEDRTVPVPVAGGFEFMSLSSRGAHTCGQTSGGATYCWGYNEYGQLGDGTRTHRPAPVRSDS
jgi:alpha-tubulin suppressor-like RCC1 family protein